MKGTLYPEYIKKIIPAIPKTVLLFTPFTVTRFAMHRKTNLLNVLGQIETNGDIEIARKVAEIISIMCLTNLK